MITIKLYLPFLLSLAVSKAMPGHGIQVVRTSHDVSAILVSKLVKLDAEKTTELRTLPANDQQRR